jgi:hypothetical protein
MGACGWKASMLLLTQSTHGPTKDTHKQLHAVPQQHRLFVIEFVGSEQGLR